MRYILLDLSVEIYSQLKFTASLFFSYRAEAWTKRFDSEEAEKLDDFGKLLHNPKLNSAHAFLDRHLDWSGRLFIISI